MKIDQITITLISKNYTEFEKMQKSMLHFLTDLLLPNRSCQIHSMTAHTVARQAHTE